MRGYDMATMMFYILDYQFDLIGVIDIYKSAIWTERFYTSGDFELYVPSTDYYSELLRMPYNNHTLYVLRADDLTKLGIIERIQYVKDPDSGDMIMVTGHTDDYILHNRLIMEQATYSGNLELAVRHMVTNALILSDFGYTARQLNNLSLGAKIGLVADIDLQYQGQLLNEEIDKLAKEHGFGYDMAYDWQNKAFTFSLKASVDRSTEQTINPPVLFSTRLDNITNQEYDKELTINAAYAYGEGNGSFKYSNGYALSGISAIERREGYVDAANTSNNGDALSSRALAKLLQQEAKAKVTRAHNSSEAIQAEVLPNTNYKLGVDYNLGDIVQVLIFIGKAREQRRSFKQKVIEVIEAFDETGYSCIPTFETVEN